jgi:hypothetical protein
MNWFLLGGGALIVFWLAGRRVAKRDAATPEPLFGSSDGGGAAGAGGAAYYGGGGGGDGGLSLASPAIAPIGSDIKASEPKFESLQASFMNAIGFSPYDKTVSQYEEEDRSAFPRSASLAGARGVSTKGDASLRSAQVASATTTSTALGQSTLSMSALPATVNNANAVSSAVQAQPPRSFSSVSASISEKNMMPTIYATPSVQVAKPAVSIAAPMPVQQSFVAAIRPVSLALSPASRLASAVRR